MGRRDAVLLIVLGAAWGAVYPLTTVALRVLDPPGVIVARTGLAALVLLPLAAHRRVLGALRTQPGDVLMAAALQATIPLVLLTVGQQHVSASLAAILVATQPVWTAVITATLTQAVSGRETTGVLVGLAGVVLLFLRDLDIGDTTGWGGAALLVSAVFYAAGAVYIQHRLPRVPALATATAAMVISALALAPFAAVAAPPTPDPAILAWIVVLGVVATGAALVGFYALIHRIGAVRASLISYLAPAFAVTYGVILLGDRPSPYTFAGMALILAGSHLATRGR